MRFYAAPMEGLTGYIFRNAHRACFPGTDAYFTPFVSPNQNHEFSAREINDLLPEHNAGTPVIPQILTNNADDFLWAARAIADMGYAEVNLNLGCPSPTVVTKGKGSGMLGDLCALDRFLDGIFASSPVKISVKTRIGLNDEGHFPVLIEIFNRYPLAELIVHPRVQADMYKKPVRMEAFEDIVKEYRGRLVYNGDLFSPEGISALSQKYTELTGIMCGRGLIANPHLFGVCMGLSAPDKAILRTFHDTILEGYQKTMPGDKALLFKMKELWTYMGCLFPERGSFDKKLRKASKLSEYKALTDSLFSDYEPVFSAFYRP